MGSTTAAYPATGKWAYWDMDTKAPTKSLAYDAARRVFPAKMQAKKWSAAGSPPPNSVRHVTVTAGCGSGECKAKERRAAAKAAAKASVQVEVEESEAKQSSPAGRKGPWLGRPQDICPGVQGVERAPSSMVRRGVSGGVDW